MNGSKKNLVILGAGTAGSMMMNKLHMELDPADWSITVIDRETKHYYQPGFLFMPFQGIQTKREEGKIVHDTASLLPEGVRFIQSEVDQVFPERNSIGLFGRHEIEYDVLVVATGVHTSPEDTEGLKGPLWYKDIFDFYTYEGALLLSRRLQDWKGGRLVINLAESVIKCPVAPLEFAFLADAFFVGKGMRDKVDIVYVTPLSGAFTRTLASEYLSDLLVKKGIEVIPDFYLEKVDNENRYIVSYDEQKVRFDLLISVPVNKGADWVSRSGMEDDDDLNLVRTNKNTLQALGHENIFVVGDASNIPTSKAGSVAHFGGEVAFENILDYINWRPLSASFDGHANCFIETGFGKASLIDFNYDTQPLPGVFPMGFLGPLKLLKETRINHYGKLLFRMIYWNFLVKGRKLPLESKMSMKGKKQPTSANHD